MARPWRTVRVFISSTFRDMHAERDHLVRVVFPELRERCAKRHIHMVDVDLRWGVTEAESEHGKVLEVCLDEINCSRPFFVGILGERYGSVLDTVPDDAILSYPWLPEYAGHSLTALEIVHGVLRNPDLAHRSFFYFRDPQFITQVPESKRADYMAEDAEAARELAALKNKIRTSGRPVMDNYPCRWDDAQTRLVDLNVFAQQVLEDLWTAIRAEYPEEAPETDPLAVERQMHEAFADERSRLHIGREEQATRLTEYVQGTDRRPVVITGESGCGKSAFLASWYRQHAANHPDDFVLAYFIGASPASTNHLCLLRNMGAELKHTFNLKEEIPQDDKKLPATLAMLLLAAVQGRSRIVVVVDALDQLSPLEGTQGLGWLLDCMPEKARLVVSTLKGDCLEVLRRREAEEIPLPPLSPNEQRQIVQTVLAEWRRKLDEQQMAALVAHPGGENPLYLRVALEELRLFGRFEQLTARIESLPADVAGLFDQVLARLEEDHGQELVAEAFSLLGCSRYGLSEVELLELLRREGERQLPRALWARLHRSAKAYLVQRGELIGFFHRQLREAAVARYLSKENKHAKLATYFAHSPVERKIDEYPYQLQHAEDWQALAAALSDLDFCTYAWDHKRRYEWIAYWRSLKGRFEPGPCYQAAMDERIKREGETEDMARLLQATGLFLGMNGMHSFALPLLIHAVQINERVLEPNNTHLAYSLCELAKSYSCQGKHANALSLYLRVLEIGERIHDLKLLSWGLAGSSACYYELGIQDKALTYGERALEIEERLFGPDSEEVAITLIILSKIYYVQHNRTKCLQFSERALQNVERVYGDDDVHIQWALENLAVMYHDAGGKLSDSQHLLEWTLQINERTFGREHPIALKNAVSLGTVYVQRVKWAKALRLLMREIGIFKKVLLRNPETRRYVIELMAIPLFPILGTACIVCGVICTLSGSMGPVTGAICILVGVLILFQRVRIVWISFLLLGTLRILKSPSLSGVLLLLIFLYLVKRYWNDVR